MAIINSIQMKYWKETVYFRLLNYGGYTANGNGMESFKLISIQCPVKTEMDIRKLQVIFRSMAGAW